MKSLTLILASSIHIMVHFCLIIITDCQWRIVKRCQKICFDIPDFCCVPVQTEKHIFNMRIIEFHKTILYKCHRLVHTSNPDGTVIGHHHHFGHQFHQLVNIFLLMIFIFDAFFNQFPVNLHLLNHIPLIR